MKILSAAFAHETNTFCILETNIESFSKQVYLTESDAIRDYALKSPSSLGATYEAAEKFGWSLCVPVAAVANPSGRVTTAAFEEIVGLMLSKWDSSFDGAILHLHGAMVTEDIEDAEGELLARFRQKHSNKDVPIIVTLDLHGMTTILHVILSIKMNVSMQEISRRKWPKMPQRLLLCGLILI
jgi:microcystin degradation protein MlrC